jgi:hypothetical protein
MLSDPLTITVNSVAKVMARILIEGSSATYQTSDALFTEKVSHQKSNKRIRSMIRVDQLAVVPDPLTTVNDYETLGVYIVIDRPEVGFSVAQIQQLAAGLFAQVDATLIGKLVGREF